MTTNSFRKYLSQSDVVEVYRLDRYDNSHRPTFSAFHSVVEVYRLDRYDNTSLMVLRLGLTLVVEVYRLDRYDNTIGYVSYKAYFSCRSLSFG